MANKQTIVDIPLNETKTHLEASYKQLERAMNSANAKYGSDHPVAKGYTSEFNKIATVIATLKEA